MIRDNIEQQYKKGLRWSLAGSLSALAVQLLQSILFARLATPQEVGAYALALTIISFLLPIAEAGLGQAVVQAKVIYPDQIAALGWLNGALGVALWLLLWACSSVFANWFSAPDLQYLLPTMGLSLLFTPFGAQYGSLLVRQLLFGTSAALELLSGTIGMLVSALLLAQNWGVWAMAWAFLVKNGVATIGVWWCVRRHIEIPWRRPGRLRDAIHLVHLGIFDLSARWADIAANSADKLIIGKMAGATVLGWYNMAFGLFLIPISRVGAVVGRVAFPVAARLQGNQDWVQAFFERSSRQLMMMLFPVYALMILFSKKIILLLYGNNWLSAAPILVALGYSGIAQTIGAQLAAMAKGAGLPKMQLRYSLWWGVCLNTVLAATLWANPSGAAAAWSRLLTSLTFGFGLCFWFAHKLNLRFMPVLKFGLIAGLSIAIFLQIVDQVCSR